MKRCGHMFREKLPFSDLWTELRKVATLKRKVGLLPSALSWRSEVARACAQAAAADPEVWSLPCRQMSRSTTRFWL